MQRTRREPQLTVMPMALAYCYGSALMRPFLRHRPALLAIIVVAVDDMAGYFASALEIIFEGRPLYGVRRAASNFSITTIKGGRQSRKQIVGSAHSGDKNTILIFTDETDVPPEYRAAADIYHVVKEFRPTHFKGAIYRVCGNALSDEDARYLGTVPIDRLTAAFRSGRPASRSLQILKRADGIAQAKNASEIADEQPKVGIEELIGYGAAREWGLQLARDIKLYSSGRLPWSDVDPGLLLSGPTGTGKTRFAVALSHSTGLPLVQGSVAQWQAAGHLGDMLREMRATFKAALEQAPAILLIDEIDSLGDRTQLRGESEQYSRQVINSALELMDGALERPGVILIGTTNYPEQVDSALLRPGRIDHHVRIALPDESARLAILSQRLKIEIDENTARDVAQLTDDWTGAQLEQLSRRTRRVARELSREVLPDDIISAMPESVLVSRNRLWTTAIHESGHAIVGAVLGLEIERIKIADRYFRNVGQAALGSVQFRRDHDARRTLASYKNEICMMLAGIAAELEVFGDHDDGAGGADGSDLRIATRLATLIESSYGMGRTLISEPDTEPGLTALRLRDGELWGRIHSVLHAEMNRSREIIRANQATLNQLADTMVEKRKMSGDELRIFFTVNKLEISLPDESVQLGPKDLP